MKQIFLVGLKVDISYDLVEKKLFKGWQVYKSYANEYAISKVRPYYAETFEEARQRYIKQKLDEKSWGIRDILKSSENFSWDVFCNHKFYEECAKSIFPQLTAIRNYSEKYEIVNVKEVTKIKTIALNYLLEYLSAEDFKEWFWDTEVIKKLVNKENKSKETIIETIESSNDKDFELPF